MKLRATLTPIATPAPSVPAPTPAETASAPTKAEMDELLPALMSTAPTGLAALPIVLPEMIPFVRVVAMFVDSAPPPLTETELPPPAATDTEAATADAEIAPLSNAPTATSPPPTVLFVISAVTSASMVLCASDRPIATPTAVPVLGEIATAPPAVTAKISAASFAVTDRPPPASIELERTDAVVSESIRLNEPVTTPATLMLLPPLPPPMATAPPPASAVMFDSVSAATWMRPPTVRSASRTMASVFASMPL